MKEAAEQYVVVVEDEGPPGSPASTFQVCLKMDGGQDLDGIIVLNDREDAREVAACIRLGIATALEEGYGIAMGKVRKQLQELELE